MSTLVITLVLISAFLHSLKSYFTKRASDKLAFFWCYCFLGLIFYAPFALFSLVENPPALSTVLYWGIIAGLVHLTNSIFSARSFEYGELSLVYPIMRSSPAVVAVLAVIFLNETISLLGALGIAIVVFGAYIVNLKGLSFQDILKPFTQIFSDKGTMYAFLTMLSVALCTLVDKLAVNDLSPFFYAYLHEFANLILFTPYILKHRKISDIKECMRVDRKSIIWNAVINIGGYGLIIYSFTLEQISYVVGLRQLSVVFAVLLGGKMLLEQQFKVRLTASALIVLGSLLIVLAH